MASHKYKANTALVRMLTSLRFVRTAQLGRSLAYLSYEYWPSPEKPVGEVSKASEVAPPSTLREAQPNEVRAPKPELPDPNNG